jgi:hypothetical protein
MKSNPFNKSNPFQVHGSISHNINPYYQPSTYDQNILQQNNYIYSNNETSKLNYLNPTNKHN